jgi:hypothetical protein
MVGLLRSLAELAQATKAKGSAITEDGYAGPEWDRILSCSTALLSCDIGRLDGGEMSRQFEALRAGGGDDDSTSAALAATAAIGPTENRPPARASRKSAKESTVEHAPIGTKRLTDRQRDLLSLVEVSLENIAVYTGQEHIPDWGALKSVMEALGGKWRTKKGFLFAEDVDAKELVRLAQETGEILDEKEAEFFETPDWLADQLAEWVDPQDGDILLEPSAGRGAIVRAIVKRCNQITVECFEPMPKLAAELERIGQVRIVGSDFMAGRYADGSRDYFSGSALNPPFSGRRDIRHITRAFELVKPGGRLAAIASAGVLYREDREYQAFRALIESHGGTIEKNPEGSFKHVGTGVSTVIIRVRKAEH